MSGKIAIIDYEMGNLKSVAKAFEHVGASVVVTRNAQEIRSAAKIVLPGVGAYQHCMENLEKYDLIDVIGEQIRGGKPFLGICLGLQLLFDESEENGGTRGLGIVPGVVKKFDFGSDLKVPHMGWNQIRFDSSDNALFKSLDEGAEFYFVHSYYVCPEDESVIAAATEYGIDFCSAIHRDNIFACQFHPEKSQKNGLKIINNFFRL